MFDVHFKPGEKEHILLTHPDNAVETITIKGQSLYSGEVEDLADSRANVAAILALFESAQSGKPVMI